MSTGQGLLGNNMFAYCNNNPINVVDSSGRLPVRNTMLMTSDSGVVSSKVKAQYIIHFKKEYSYENWKNATRTEKMQLLVQYKEELGQALNVATVPGINFFYEEPGSSRSTRASYSFKYRSVGVNAYQIYNTDATTSYALFQSVRHEMRHAYQHAASFGLHRYGYERAYNEEWATLSSWDQNILDYIDPKIDPAGYVNQAIEVDARAFAGQVYS